MTALSGAVKENWDDMFSHCDTIPACDGQTDGRTDGIAVPISVDAFMNECAEAR